MTELCVSDFIRTSSGAPCPLCSRTHSCSHRSDGLHFCLDKHGEIVPGFRYVGDTFDDICCPSSSKEVHH
jgi:hypothetical protein